MAAALWIHSGSRMYSNVQDGNILFTIAPHHSSAVPTLMSIAYQTSSGSHSSNVQQTQLMALLTTAYIPPQSTSVTIATLRHLPSITRQPCVSSSHLISCYHKHYPSLLIHLLIYQCLQLSQSVGISGGCASMRNVLLSPESRYIPYFLLFSFILRAVGPILSFSPFIL